MKILEVGRYKSQFVETEHVLPFVHEQGEALRALGTNVRYFPIRGNYVRSAVALRSIIDEWHPDVIHAHYGLSGMTAAIAAKCMGKHVPLVITFHNGETLNWHVNLLSSSFSLLADHVIYVAQHIHDLSYLKAKHYTILPCGVTLKELPLRNKEEARRKLGYSVDKKYILFGGGFTNLRKNYPLLRNAVEQLTNAEDMEIEVVEMKGLTRAECALRMCACDVFALPTHSEGSPQALKEAMACSCPIVATEVADIRHLLGTIPGHYLLRNPSNDMSYWREDKDSCNELVALLKEAIAFGGRTEGRKRITELGLENRQIAETLMGIYSQLLTKHE